MLEDVPRQGVGRSLQRWGTIRWRDRPGVACEARHVSTATTPCIPVPLEGIIDFILMIYDNDFANEMSSSDADGSSGIPISYSHPLLRPVSTLFGCL